MRENIFPAIGFIALMLLTGCESDLVTPTLDGFKYDGNYLKIHFFGHSSLMFDFNGTIIYTDPVKNFADYSSRPKADIILITHEHGDHLDISTIGLLTKDTTALVVTQAVYDKIKRGEVLENGESKAFPGISVKAVPAYNTSPERLSFHQKGVGNGYIVDFGHKRVYIAGDTENITEMADFGSIDIAFLPANLPYTMSLEQVVQACNILRPHILYPYHYGETDISGLEALLKDLDGVELRIKNLK